MVQNVVFDIGGVLVDWNPRYLYSRVYPNQPEFVEWFLANICTSEWNETQDGGRTLAEGTRILIEEHPHHEAPIRLFYERHQEMFSGAFQKTVEALEELVSLGVPTYALTNWSGELFPAAKKRFPFLNLFRGIVVSGDERLKKPDPAIYQLLLNRYQLTPETTLFIDDRLSNIETARNLGFQTLHFAGPDDLKVHLRALRVLPQGR